MRTPLYDALIIVHPDWEFGYDDPIPSEYKDSLEQEIARYRAQGRPVFLYPSIRPTPGSGAQVQVHPALQPSLCDVLTMPDQEWDDEQTENENVRRLAQIDADFIALHSDKKPEETAVGLGGMYSDACVYAVAHSICGRVRTNYRDRLLWIVRAPRPLRYGRVLDHIVWHYTGEAGAAASSGTRPISL